MFRTIQNYLLVRHPLLWNTKIVPATFILIVINLVFFIIGFFQGEINFTENQNTYNYGDDGMMVFFGILLSFLFIILWLVYYFKNNSFKTFYPKTNFSLFKEWLIIVFTCLLISLFTTSYFYGKDTRYRSYYSKEEARKRCEILSEGSFFVEGSYTNHYSYDDSETMAAETAVETVVQDSATGAPRYYVYKGKKYEPFALLNKNLNSYTFFDHRSDSLRADKLRDWLVGQQKDSLKNLFRRYLAIAKEHHLQSNIDAEKWLSLINDYPDFEDYKLIGSGNEPESYYAPNYNENNKFDTVNKYIRAIKGEQFEFWKYYVPEDQLNYNYNKISESWTQPTIRLETILISIYVAIALSLLLFSFRVTSGKNWLIALVSVVILGIAFGLLSVVISSELSFPILVMMTTIGCFGYFLVILHNKRGKGISGIVVNLLLWLLPGFFPLLYFTVLERLKNASYSYSDYYKSPYYPTIKLMEDNALMLLYLNVLFVILAMVFYSGRIKKWKGLAEN